MMYVNILKITDILPFSERDENDINFPVCINILLTKTYENIRRIILGRIQEYISIYLD